MARKATIQAKITEARQISGPSDYLRIEATDGRTYYRVIDRAGKRCLAPVYGVWRTGSREIDRPVAFGAMPKAVRDLMHANPNPFA